MTSTYPITGASLSGGLGFSNESKTSPTEKWKEKAVVLSASLRNSLQDELSAMTNSLKTYVNVVRENTVVTKSLHYAKFMTVLNQLDSLFREVNLDSMIGKYLTASAQKDKIKFITTLDQLESISTALDATSFKDLIDASKNMKKHIEKASSDMGNSIEIPSNFHVPTPVDTTKRGGLMVSSEIIGAGPIDSQLVDYMDFSSVVRELRRVSNLSNIKDNLQRTSKEMDSYRESYPQLLGKFSAEIIDKIQDEHVKTLTYFKSLGLNADQLECVTEYFDLRRRARVDIVKASEKLDLFLASDVTKITSSPDKIANIAELLSKTVFIRKWYSDESIRKVMDITYAGVEITNIQKKHQFTSAVENIGKAYRSVGAIQNVFSAFLTIGEYTDTSNFDDIKRIHNILLQFITMKSITLNYTRADGVNFVPSLSITGFGSEDEDITDKLFMMIMKSIVTKILAVADLLRVYTIPSQASDINSSYTVRRIFGGSSSVDPKFVEPTVRATLLLEYYNKSLFKFSEIPKRDFDLVEMHNEIQVETERVLRIFEIYDNSMNRALGGTRPQSAEPQPRKRTSKRSRANEPAPLTNTVLPASIPSHPLGSVSNGATAPPSEDDTDPESNASNSSVDDVSNASQSLNTSQQSSNNTPTVKSAELDKAYEALHNMKGYDDTIKKFQGLSGIFDLLSTRMSPDDVSKKLKSAMETPVTYDETQEVTGGNYRSQQVTFSNKENAVRVCDIICNLLCALFHAFLQIHQVLAAAGLTPQQNANFMVFMTAFYRAFMMVSVVFGWATDLPDDVAQKFVNNLQPHQFANVVAYLKQDQKDLAIDNAARFPVVGGVIRPEMMYANSLHPSAFLGNYISKIQRMIKNGPNSWILSIVPDAKTEWQEIIYLFFVKYRNISTYSGSQVREIYSAFQRVITTLLQKKTVTMENLTHDVCREIVIEVNRLHGFVRRKEVSDLIDFQYTERFGNQGDTSSITFNLDILKADSKGTNFDDSPSDKFKRVAQGEVDIPSKKMELEIETIHDAVTSTLTRLNQDIATNQTNYISLETALRQYDMSKMTDEEKISHLTRIINNVETTNSVSDDAVLANKFLVSMMLKDIRFMFHSVKRIYNHVIRRHMRMTLAGLAPVAPPAGYIAYPIGAVAPVCHLHPQVQAMFVESRLPLERLNAILDFIDPLAHPTVALETSSDVLEHILRMSTELVTVDSAMKTGISADFSGLKMLIFDAIRVVTENLEIFSTLMNTEDKIQHNIELNEYNSICNILFNDEYGLGLTSVCSKITLNDQIIGEVIERLCGEVLLQDKTSNVLSEQFPYTIIMPNNQMFANLLSSKPLVDIFNSLTRRKNANPIENVSDYSTFKYEPNQVTLDGLNKLRNFLSVVDNYNIYQGLVVKSSGIRGGAELQEFVLQENLRDIEVDHLSCSVMPIHMIRRDMGDTIHSHNEIVTQVQVNTLITNQTIPVKLLVLPGNMVPPAVLPPGAAAPEKTYRQQNYAPLLFGVAYAAGVKELFAEQLSHIESQIRAHKLFQTQQPAHTLYPVTFSDTHSFGRQMNLQRVQITKNMANIVYRAFLLNRIRDQLAFFARRLSTGTVVHEDFNHYQELLQWLQMILHGSIIVTDTTGGAEGKTSLFEKHNDVMNTKEYLEAGVKDLKLSEEEQLKFNKVLNYCELVQQYFEHYSPKHNDKELNIYDGLRDLIEKLGPYEVPEKTNEGKVKTIKPVNFVFISKLTETLLEHLDKDSSNSYWSIFPSVNKKQLEISGGDAEKDRIINQVMSDLNISQAIDIILKNKIPGVINVMADTSVNMYNRLWNTALDFASRAYDNITDWPLALPHSFIHWGIPQNTGLLMTQINTYNNTFKNYSAMRSIGLASALGYYALANPSARPTRPAVEVEYRTSFVHEFNVLLSGLLKDSLDPIVNKFPVELVSGFANIVGKDIHSDALCIMDTMNHPASDVLLSQRKVPRIRNAPIIRSLNNVDECVLKSSLSFIKSVLYTKNLKGDPHYQYEDLSELARQPHRQTLRGLLPHYAHAFKSLWNRVNRLYLFTADLQSAHSKRMQHIGEFARFLHSACSDLYRKLADTPTWSDMVMTSTLINNTHPIVLHKLQFDPVGVNVMPTELRYNVLYNTRLILALDDVELKMEHIARAIPGFKSLESLLPTVDIVPRVLKTMQMHTTVLRTFYQGLCYKAEHEQFTHYQNQVTKNKWEGFSNQTIHNNWTRAYVVNIVNRIVPAPDMNNAITMRDRLRISNIVDLDMVPINVSSFMRSVPFVNLLNFSLGFDEYFAKLFPSPNNLGNDMSMNSFLKKGLLQVAQTPGQLRDNQNAFSHFNALKFTNQFPGLVGDLVVPNPQVVGVTGGGRVDTDVAHNNYMVGYYLFKCITAAASQEKARKKLPAFLRTYEDKFIPTVSSRLRNSFNKQKVSSLVDLIKPAVVAPAAPVPPQFIIPTAQECKDYVEKWMNDKGIQAPVSAVITTIMNLNIPANFVLSSTGAGVGVGVNYFQLNWNSNKSTKDSVEFVLEMLVIYLENFAGGVALAAAPTPLTPIGAGAVTGVLPVFPAPPGPAPPGAPDLAIYGLDAPFTAESFLGWVTVAQESIQRIVASQALFVKSAVETGHKTLLSNSMTRVDDGDVDVWDMESVILK